MGDEFGERNRKEARKAGRKGPKDIGKTVDNGSAQTNSGARTVQSDEDVVTAIQLAERAEREQLYHEDDLSIHGPGRIIVRCPCNNKSHLPSTVDAALFAFVLAPATAASTCSAHTSWSEDSADTTYSEDLGDFSFVDRYLITPCDPIDPNLEHRPSKDLLSEAHIDLINRWRRECEAEHESCRRTAFDQLLPSRVIEILDLNDDKKGVRLIETGHKMQGMYACLSYCWGSLETQIGQTTHENLSGYLQHIPFNELPLTVIDTIRLCFKLGFRFLWVDRLCIVQDDPKDWLEEASRMCEVYSRSALTISVPLCNESSESFLAERHKGFQKEDEFCIIDHRGVGGKPRSSAWIHDEPWRFSMDGPWFLEGNWEGLRDKFSNKTCSWLQRGWTYQEWMLSPRVLHIDSMTLWDCFGGYANELNRRYMEEPCLIRNPEEIEKDSGLTWRELVEEYSRRKITREEDRLPALAGLAARHAQATGDIYVAGLWRENLHWWLLWQPGIVRHTSSQSAPNRHVPSWSWASSGSNVSFRDPSLMFETDALFVSVFCQYDPPGSLTSVKKAWIDIECGISAVTEQTPEYENPMMAIKAMDAWWYGFPDDGSKYPDDLIGQGKIYLLHLQQDPERNLALVLKEHGCEDGLRCFQRIGVASLKGDDDFDYWQLPVREKLPVHGDMRQIIRLV